MYKKIFYTLIAFGLLALLISACGSATTATPSESQPTFTSAPPTPKPTATQVVLTRPSAASYILAYDPDMQQILLIGNQSVNTDVWAYDVASQKLTRLQDKPAISVQCLDYDAKAKGVITLSKGNGVTWFFSPAKNEWTELAQGKPDQYYTLGGLCFFSYDSALDKMVTLTEGTPLNFTSFYDYSTNAWTHIQLDPSPSRNVGQMVYDSETNRILLWDATVYKRMWTLDVNANTWEMLTYTGGPNQGGWLSSMVYVPDLDRTYVYLYDQFYAYDDNTNTWEQAKGALKPGSRVWTSMAYDPVAKKIVLYGGYDEKGTTSFDDLWLYDPQTGEWTEQQLP
jgi:hypothetical protein